MSLRDGSATSDLLLFRAGHLITHPSPIPECEIQSAHTSDLDECLHPSPHFAISSVVILEAPQAFHCLLPLHCCNLSDSPLDTRITDCDNHLNIFMYITLPLDFALIILHFTHSFWYILLSKPIPSLHHHHPPATIKSHPFKSSGILKVLELKQAYQIQHDISILKLESLILRMI